MQAVKFSWRRLGMHLLLDAVGWISYAVPGLGESIDLIWAPLSSYLLMKMYPGTVGKVAGLIEFAEEILPGTDFIPTFTLTYLYTLWENRVRGINSSTSSNRGRPIESHDKRRNNKPDNAPR